MFRPNSEFEVTRRQLILGALGTAASGVMLRFLGTPALANCQTLYVNMDRDMSLSLGAPALQDRPRPWTWRMVYADAWTGDPDAELKEQAQDDARTYFADYRRTAFVGGEFDELAFQRFLESPHPLSGTMTLTRQFEEYLTRTSSTARAYDLVDGILDAYSRSEFTQQDQALDLIMDYSSAGKCAWLTQREDIPVLGDAIQKLRLLSVVRVFGTSEALS